MLRMGTLMLVGCAFTAWATGCSTAQRSPTETQIAAAGESSHQASASANFEAVPAGRMLWVLVTVDVPEDDEIVWQACDGQPPVVSWTLPPGWQDSGTMRPLADYRSATPDSLRGEFRMPFAMISKIRVPDEAAAGSRVELTGSVTWKTSALRRVRQSTSFKVPVEVLDADATPRPSPEANRVQQARAKLGLNEAQAEAKLREADRGDLEISVDGTSGEARIGVPGAAFIVLDPGPTCSPLADFNAAARPGGTLKIPLKPTRRTLPSGEVLEGYFLDGVIEVFEADRTKWIIQLNPHLAAKAVPAPTP